MWTRALWLLTLLALPCWAQNTDAYTFVCSHPKHGSPEYRRLKENSLERLLARGTAYHGRGNWSRALADFQQAERLAPNDPRVQYHLAGVYFSTGRMEPAIQYYQRTLGMRPGMFMARGRLGMSLWIAGRRAEARPYLEERFQTPPRTATDYRDLAYTFFFVGRYQEAMETAQEGIRKFPDQGPHVCRGRTLVALKQPRKALADFDRAVKLFPDNAHLRLYRSQVNQELGRTRQAAADMAVRERLRTEVLY